MPRGFSIKLHSETQVSDLLGMSRGRSLRHAQKPRAKENALNNPPNPITPTLTLTSVHHFISSIDEKKLAKHQLNYSTIEKEAVALQHSMEHLEHRPQPIDITVDIYSQRLLYMYISFLKKIVNHFSNRHFVWRFFQGENSYDLIFEYRIHTSAVYMCTKVA